ncbi:MAG: hypothetical protein J6U54_01175 [Clostridiales bacterium]|nr:hypothetical protein [Clostridiales bacterium]
MAKSMIKPYTEGDFKTYNWDEITRNKHNLAKFIKTVTSCCCMRDDTAVDCKEVGCPMAAFRGEGEETCDREAIMLFLCAEVETDDSSCRA